MKWIRQGLSSWRIAVVAGIFPLFVSSFLTAQQPLATEIQRYQKHIADCNQVIASWQWEARLQIFFVLLIIVFGALIAGLQIPGRGPNQETTNRGAKRAHAEGANTEKTKWNGWRAITVGILGGLTVALTSINAKLFPADYRVLQQSVIEGSQMVDQLNEIVDNLTQPNADVAGLKSQWLTTKTQFTGLQKAVLQGTNKIADLVSRGTTVYAQSRVPTWISHPPTDDYNLYFAGTGEDTSIEAARQRSIESAVATAVNKVSADSGADPEALRPIITSSVAVDKSYFEYDKGKGVYRYHTLVRISNDIRQFSTAGAHSESKTITVLGNKDWTDTGIRVRKGDTILFTATGRVQWAPGQEVGPDGSKRKLKPAILRPGYPVSTIGAGGLIAKIGSGNPFAVGNSAKISANESGQLYVGINDNGFGNNGGQFSVTIVWTSSGSVFLK